MDLLINLEFINNAPRNGGRFKVSLNNVENNFSANVDEIRSLKQSFEFFIDEKTNDFLANEPISDSLKNKIIEQIFNFVSENLIFSLNNVLKEIPTSYSTINNRINNIILFLRKQNLIFKQKFSYRSLDLHEFILLKNNIIGQLNKIERDLSEKNHAIDEIMSENHLNSEYNIIIEINDLKNYDFDIFIDNDKINPKLKIFLIPEISRAFKEKYIVDYKSKIQDAMDIMGQTKRIIKDFDLEDFFNHYFSIMKIDQDLRKYQFFYEEFIKIDYLVNLEAITMFYDKIYNNIKYLFSLFRIFEKKIKNFNQLKFLNTILSLSLREIVHMKKEDFNLFIVSFLEKYHDQEIKQIKAFPLDLYFYLNNEEAKKVFLTWSDTYLSEGFNNIVKKKNYYTQMNKNIITNIMIKPTNINMSIDRIFNVAEGKRSFALFPSFLTISGNKFNCILYIDFKVLTKNDYRKVA